MHVAYVYVCVYAYMDVWMDGCIYACMDILYGYACMDILIILDIHLLGKLLYQCVKNYVEQMIWNGRFMLKIIKKIKTIHESLMIVNGILHI